MRRKFLENRVGALGIIAILLAILLAGSEVAYVSIGMNGYRLDLDSDCLPEELIKEVREKGFSFEITEHPHDVLWKSERHTGVMEINCVMGQLFETKLTFSENPRSGHLVYAYVYEYIVTAKNTFDRTLFSLHVRGTFINMGVAKGLITVIPYADSHVSFLFRMRWYMNSLNQNHSNKRIYTEGLFFDRFKQETVKLWASISYDIYGNHSEAGGIEI